MDNKREEYKLVFEHFKSMEQRYHTWMNYYSLFNGALLVAYCSILVSMGKISPKDGGYELNCTYWDFLVLIALLGLWASLCWLLSIKGHNSWLNSWRLALRSYGYEFDSHIYLREKDYDKEGEDILHINPPFYSTAKVTTSFIGGVIIAWFLALAYATVEYCGYLFKNFYSDLSNMYIKIFNRQGLGMRILRYKSIFRRIRDLFLSIIKWTRSWIKRRCFWVKTSKWEVESHQEKEDSSNSIISQSIDVLGVTEEVIKEIIKRLGNKNVEVEKEQKTDTDR